MLTNPAQAEIDAGQVELVSGEEVFARLFLERGR